MHLFKKVSLFFPILLLLFFVVSPAYAAAPDGLGPWADSVFSFHQGVMKNGLAVPAARSDPTGALGVAENTPAIDATFFALGFGGNIVLGFDNGISSGALVIESTIEPNYPVETARVEMSQDGIHWIMAGNVVDDGTVNKPQQINCAKYVKITDTSIPANYPDDIADGYDVDGVKATGDLCIPTTPTPTPTRGPQGPQQPTHTPTPTPTQAPTQSPTQPQSNSGSSNSSSGGSSSGGSSSSSNNSSTTCTPTTITTVPNIILAKRLSPTSIFVSWGPNAGLNNFIVQYGFQNGNWQFSTKVSGFSTTIDNLPTDQSIWIEVAATDNCSIGSYGNPVLVGGTPSTNSPGFPNTGSNPCIKTSSNPLVPCFPNTGLPNTGFAPTILGSIASGIQYLFSLFFNALKMKR